MHACMWAGIKYARYIQVDTHAGRQASRQASKEASRQAGRQAGRRAGREGSPHLNLLKIGNSHSSSVLQYSHLLRRDCGPAPLSAESAGCRCSFTLCSEPATALMQAGRHTRMQSCTHTCRHAGRHAGMQADRHAGCQACRYAGMQACRQQACPCARHLAMHAAFVHWRHLPDVFRVLDLSPLSVKIKHS